MTPIRAVLVSDATTTLRRTATAAILGAVCGFSAAISVMQYVPVAMAGNEAAMMAACRLPDVNGAVTIFIMRDGKIECYRHR